LSVQPVKGSYSCLKRLWGKHSSFPWFENCCNFCTRKYGEILHTEKNWSKQSESFNEQ